MILMICTILGPQFIYQIRPYTFYISGFTIGLIVITTFLPVVVLPSAHIRLSHLLLLILGFVVGFHVDWGVIQYFVIGGMIAYLVIYLLAERCAWSIQVSSSVLTLICLSVFVLFCKPLKHFEIQRNYEDQVVYERETQYHKLVITQWQRDHWFFIDQLKNICSIDEYLFYEPMAHSAFQVNHEIKDVLVIGGENGCLVRELLKYDHVDEIRIAAYDKVLLQLGHSNRYFTSMNDSAFHQRKVQVVDENMMDFLLTDDHRYDAIFIDLPDPRSIETNQFYTTEFYNLPAKMLKQRGVLVTQAGSPYFATRAFYAIGKTIRECGFDALPIHNQVLTLGEWGWYVCSKDLNEHEIKTRITDFVKTDIPTKWWNQEAASMVTSFGKTYADTLNLGINTLDNPLVFQYYLKGNWEMY